MEENCEKLQLAAGTVLKYMGIPVELARNTTIIANVRSLVAVTETSEQRGEAAQGDPAVFQSQGQE